MFSIKNFPSRDSKDLEFFEKVYNFILCENSLSESDEMYPGLKKNFNPDSDNFTTFIAIVSDIIKDYAKDCEEYFDTVEEICNRWMCADNTPYLLFKDKDSRPIVVLSLYIRSLAEVGVGDFPSGIWEEQFINIFAEVYSIPDMRFKQPIVVQVTV